jgi:leader peptidase (prepilin peptidase)/N-methyltransferase
MLAEKIILIVPFLFGAVAGSFYNVCVHRIPLGLSIVSPPSSCPACGARIPFYHNIPLVSYLMLGGRCAGCRTPIPVRYPVVEAITGGLTVALFVWFWPGPLFFVYFAFVSALVVITFIDLDHKIIPDVISLPGIAIGFACSLFLPYPGYLSSIVGILAGGGILLTIALGYYVLTGSEGMGGGDVKLLAMIGAFLGWKGVLVTLLIGSFTGALIGVVSMLVFGRSGKHQIPFGPFLALGAVVYLFFGEALISLYIERAVGA